MSLFVSFIQEPSGEPADELLTTTVAATTEQTVTLEVNWDFWPEDVWLDNGKEPMPEDEKRPSLARLASSLGSGFLQKHH